MSAMARASIAGSMLRLLGPLLVCLAAPGWAAASEMRGLWVVRTALTSPQSVDRVVDDAARGGFTALFVQVRGRGDAFYASRLAPRSEILRGQPAEFDPLGRLLERARSRGLEVHAWVNVLLSAGFGQRLPVTHVLARHPEWAMVPRGAAASVLRDPRRAMALSQAWRDDKVEGFYLSPSAPGAADHLDAVVRELLAAYAVDGLHLDFIRYPGPEYDYSPATLTAYARLKGTTSPLAAPAQFPEGWADYRRRALDTLAERLSRTARATRPGAVVSAAVVPDEVQAVHERFQAWPEWTARGILDAVCPMAYTPDSRLFRQQVERVRARVGPAMPVWAGVGAYRLPFEGVVEKIRLARDAGASGVVLFSHESLASTDLDRLRAAFTLPGGAAGAPAGASR
jgi:uncharacterized lipoprotein YddW (UPF0748 family)